jgi:DNA polymerase/3'-5' exonuclease PolX
MFPYRQAIKIAEDLLHHLKPSCERIEIVGSLRRRKSHVNDVDIIAIPAYSTGEAQTLFGDPVQQNLLEIRLSDLCAGNGFTMQTNGPKIKRLLKQRNGTSMPIDIYIASESTWWTLMLIRTGSRGHNIALARRAIQKHMVLKADGTGLLTAGGSIISIDSEETIFHHLELPFRSPEERG